MIIARILTVALFAVLILVVAGTGYWGYQEHQDKNSVLIKAENNYQRAFHDLNNNVSNLEDELGKSIAMNTRNLLAPCMANIWRISNEAHSNIGQLPLALTPFKTAKEFLAQLADYTFDIGMRDLENEPLTEKEWGKLKSLHGEAKSVQQDLRKLQSLISNDGIRWMDVELEVAAEEKNMAKNLNGITSGFEELDKQVQGYIETEGGALENKVTDHFGHKRTKIQGKSISEDEAERKAKRFMDTDEDVQADVTKSGESNEFTAFSVRFSPEDREHDISVDVSKQGGHVLWMLDSRDIEETELGLNEGQLKAEKFLKEREIDSMIAVESDQYDNVGVFDFVYVQDDVRVFTDVIRVKVALDNGDIVGYEALDYVMNHDDEITIDEPDVSLQEAKDVVHPNFKVMEEHLSIVEIKAGEKKLCYELLGTIEDESYRIFVNASTGDEEKVEKLKQAQPIV